MSDHDKMFNSFLTKYGVKVLNNTKRCIKHLSTLHFFNYSKDKDMFDQVQEYETEPVLTVEIPLSKLEALAELESIFFNNIDSVGSRRMFEVWYDQQIEEKELRHKHPACQSAYEQYSTVLNLCRTKPKRFKDLG